MVVQVDKREVIVVLTRFSGQFGTSDPWVGSKLSNITYVRSAPDKQCNFPHRIHGIK